ncbi:MAG: class I SAM-dependent methyltransferase [Deltaproteobacteria bacterium]
MSDTVEKSFTGSRTGEQAVTVRAPRAPPPSSPRLDAMIESVRRGEDVVNWAFDGIYPDHLGQLSPRHWTPLAVALSATRMLVTDETTRVLDVGAGVGKLCLVGALTTPGHFTGIEQRGHLVEVARRVAGHYGAGRAEYLHGDVRDVDWDRFDAFYFYNSFGENHLEPADWIDDSVEISYARFERDVPAALSRLGRARPGTRVVTYHGLGAELPPSYERRATEPAGSGALDLWLKVRP